MVSLLEGVLVFYLVPAQGMGAGVAVYRKTVQWKYNVEHGKIPRETRMKSDTKYSHSQHHQRTAKYFSSIFQRYRIIQIFVWLDWQ